MQPIDPNLDWIIETKFYFNPQGNYSGAGILLATTNGLFMGDNNYPRMGERAFYPNAGSVIGVAWYVPFTSTTNFSAHPEARHQLLRLVQRRWSELDLWRRPNGFRIRILGSAYSSFAIPGTE